MRYPYYLRYLHEKALPRNPLWYPGNPRHRIFLPLYWLRVVENRKPMPNTFVKFECHWQMSAPDIKQYLEKLYNVSVLDINIEIVRGKYIAHPKKHAALSPPMEDRKYAYVQLKNETFTFPDILGPNEEGEEKRNKEMKVMETILNKEKNKSLRRLDIGSWFF